MKIQITHLINDSILFEGEFETLKQAVESAIAQNANLRYANLSCANLRYADLSYADLSHADLSCADLSCANLSCANLRYANLSCANLSCANLSHTDLRYAQNSELAIAQTRILPEGSIIGWKKCRDSVIVKLQIPAKARRSHAFGRKCRAEYAKVLQVIGAEIGISHHDGKTEYKKGETVRCDKWDEDYTEECSGGIHFFITRIEAENY